MKKITLTLKNYLQKSILFWTLKPKLNQDKHNQGDELN